MCTWKRNVCPGCSLSDVWGGWGSWRLLNLVAAHLMHEKVRTGVLPILVVALSLSTSSARWAEHALQYQQAQEMALEVVSICSVTSKLGWNCKNGIHQHFCPWINSLHVPASPVATLKLVSGFPVCIVHVIFILLHLCWISGQVGLCVSLIRVRSLFLLVLQFSLS